MDFLQNIYPYNFEGIRNTVYEYRFTSEGKKSITKIVTLRPAILHLKIYNLGFGNLERDGENIIVNDSSTTNNTDHEKVLNTVFSCMLHFLKLEPESRVIFFGNTEHKQIYYKRRISSNIEILQEKFNVMGCTADYSVQTVETEYSYLRKNGKKTTRKIKSKNLNSLKFNKIKVIEKFQANNSKNYDFVLFFGRNQES